MTLTDWAARLKRSLYDELMAGSAPSTGEYSEADLIEGRTLGKPQMGATVYLPYDARFEFVYKGANSTIVFSVHVKPPERIVFLPVPKWVVETIWQGDIDGSYHFETDAVRLLTEFEAEMSAERNAAMFGRKQPLRRE